MDSSDKAIASVIITLILSIFIALIHHNQEISKDYRLCIEKGGDKAVCSGAIQTVRCIKE